MIYYIKTSRVSVNSMFLAHRVCSERFAAHETNVLKNVAYESQYLNQYILKVF